MSLDGMATQTTNYNFLQLDWTGNTKIKGGNSSVGTGTETRHDFLVYWTSFGGLTSDVKDQTQFDSNQSLFKFMPTNDL